MPAPAGQLDPSFGTGGLVTTPFPSGPAVGEAVVIQPDGRIVVAGFVQETTDPFEEHRDFAVARYLPNGDLDPTFGTGGRVTADFAGRDDRANTVALRPDGRILVAGTSDVLPSLTVPLGKGFFAFVQYTAGGTLDSTFGSGGVVVLDPSGVSVGGLFGGPNLAIELLPDGRFVAAGWVGFAVDAICPGPSVVTQVTTDFGLIRFNADGTPDTTFNGGNLVIDDFHGGRDLIFDVVVDDAGRITVAGQVGGTPDLCNGMESGVLGLARYQPDGTLDPAFGTGGIVETALADAAANTLVRQRDGRVVIGGEAVSGPLAGGILARFDADGDLDATFGSNGLVSASGFDGSVIGLALQPDGRIVATGEIEVGDDDIFGVARFTVDGVPDLTFGTGGYVSTSFPGTEGSEPEAVARQPDGRIVVVGYTEGVFALARCRT